MRIALLGASSQIAKDLVQSFSADPSMQLALFARSPALLGDWLAQAGLAGRHRVQDFTHFGPHLAFDAILNFVGVGDPGRAAHMGASIFEVTSTFDDLALDYLHAHPQCRYIFLSSGAAYGASFDQPVNVGTPAVIPLNNLQAQHWYGVAKLHAECRHRALAPLPIVDVRVFNYFSHTQDMNARFFITDILRAIRQQTELKTSADYMVRDYLHPADFHQIIQRLLTAPPVNQAVDCYSREPVDKSTLLASMQREFGLRYAISQDDVAVNSTGRKPCYYSTNRALADFGYLPRFGSCDGVLHEFRKLLSASIE